MAIDKERENHVYIAKLAEQAERYDGPSLSPSLEPSSSSFPLFGFRENPWSKKAKYDVWAIFSFLFSVPD